MVFSVFLFYFMGLWDFLSVNPFLPGPCHFRFIYEYNPVKTASAERAGYPYD